MIRDVDQEYAAISRHAQELASKAQNLHDRFEPTTRTGYAWLALLEDLLEDLSETRESVDL